MRIVSWAMLVAVLNQALPRLAAGDDFKPEPGFTSLFNGKDLTGWKTKKGGDSLDGKAEAYGNRFKVAQGKIVIDPLISHRLDLAQINKGFAMMKSGAALRSVIVYE